MEGLAIHGSIALEDSTRREHSGDNTATFYMTRSATSTPKNLAMSQAQSTVKDNRPSRPSSPVEQHRLSSSRSDSKRLRSGSAAGITRLDGPQLGPLTLLDLPEDLLKDIVQEVRC